MFLNWLPNIHPLIIHVPIVLIPLGFMVHFICLLIKKDEDGNGDMRFFTGPIAVLYKGGIMARIDVKIPVSESADLASLSKGIMVQTGIGFVF